MHRWYCVLNIKVYTAFRFSIYQCLTFAYRYQCRGSLSFLHTSFLIYVYLYTIQYNTTWFWFWFRDVVRYGMIRCDNSNRFSKMTYNVNRDIPSTDLWLQDFKWFPKFYHSHNGEHSFMIMKTNINLRLNCFYDLPETALTLFSYLKKSDAYKIWFRTSLYWL